MFCKVLTVSYLLGAAVDSAAHCQAWHLTAKCFLRFNDKGGSLVLSLWLDRRKRKKRLQPVYDRVIGDFIKGRTAGKLVSDSAFKQGGEGAWVEPWQGVGAVWDTLWVAKKTCQGGVAICCQH